MAFERTKRFAKRLDPADPNNLHWLRLRASDNKDRHRYLGFKTYGLTRQDLGSPEYRQILKEVADYFKWYQRAGTALDIGVDYVLPAIDVVKAGFEHVKRVFQKLPEIPKVQEQMGYFEQAVDELADVGPLYMATKKERDFCKRNNFITSSKANFNFFEIDTTLRRDSSWRRCAQMTVGGAMEQTDILAEWFGIKPENTPWYIRWPVFTLPTLIPTNTIYLTGIIFERADEQYFNRGLTRKGGLNIRASDQVKCDAKPRTNPDSMKDSVAAFKRNNAPLDDEERRSLNNAYLSAFGVTYDTRLRNYNEGVAVDPNFDVVRDEYYRAAYGMTQQEIIDLYNSFVVQHPTADPEELFRRRAA